MPDGIAKGVGEQLGSLGKQIVTEVVKAPATIAGVHETIGDSTGSAGQNPMRKKQVQFGQGKSQSLMTPEEISRQDEIHKQQQLAQARRLLQAFIQPQGQEATSVQKQLEMEEAEKQKHEIEEEKKKARALPQTGSKPQRENLYAVKSKQFGGELGKNVKSG